MKDINKMSEQFQLGYYTGQSEALSYMSLGVSIIGLIIAVIVFVLKFKKVI